MRSFDYRPPWPDEMRRTAALLPHRQALGPGWHPRVWEAQRPARLIGAAGWRLQQKSSRAQVFFNFKPRHAAGAAALEMLRPLFAEMAAGGAREAHVTLGGRERWAGPLGAFGIQWERVDEFWKIDASVARERLAASRLHAHPEKLRGWTVRPLGEDDWERVRAWAVEPGFLTVERFEQLRERNAPRISGVAEDEGGVGGLLVATQEGFQAALEFIGGNPARRRAWPVATHLLLARLFAASAPSAPFDTLVMTTNPAKGGAARALARRFGMRLAGAAHHFGGALRTLPV